MSSKTLSAAALSVIDHYLHFKFGGAVCSVPYYNNKTMKVRAAPAVNGGKGSPEQIREEIQEIAFKHHIVPDTLADEGLKKLLTDNNIGIDCSGFAWHVLNAESVDRKKGSLSKHTHFVYARGIFGKVKVALNPVKNADVQTFASDNNSRVIPLAEIAPGDMITMVGGPEDGERNHVLVIHEIQQNPLMIRYSHAVAYPEDGVYGTGIKQGVIQITDTSKPITEAAWSENGTSEGASRILARAKKSTTELRRFVWF